jgi:hypothetical protein
LALASGNEPQTVEQLVERATDRSTSELACAGTATAAPVVRAAIASVTIEPRTGWRTEPNLLMTFIPSVTSECSTGKTL